jgi:CheY-like chemotaxis protein
VALTRARRKVIVVGDSAPLSALPFYRRLVEDDEILREMLRRYLQAKGLTVFEVASGEHALAALRDRRWKAPGGFLVLD